MTKGTNRPQMLPKGSNGSYEPTNRSEDEKRVGGKRRKEETRLVEEEKGRSKGKKRCKTRENET